MAKGMFIGGEVAACKRTMDALLKCFPGSPPLALVYEIVNENPDMKKEFQALTESS